MFSTKVNPASFNAPLSLLIIHEAILDGTVDIMTESGEEFKGYDILIGADGIWSNIRAQVT